MIRPVPIKDGANFVSRVCGSRTMAGVAQRSEHLSVKREMRRSIRASGTILGLPKGRPFLF
jgi:hypothetical protein